MLRSLYFVHQFQNLRRPDFVAVLNSILSLYRQVYYKSDDVVFGGRVDCRDGVKTIGIVGEMRNRKQQESDAWAVANKKTTV